MVEKPKLEQGAGRRRARAMPASRRAQSAVDGPLSFPLDPLTATTLHASKWRVNHREGLAPSPTTADRVPSEGECARVRRGGPLREGEPSPPAEARLARGEEGPGPRSGRAGSGRGGRAAQT